MQNIKEYAPVIIPTLNRYEHLKRCVESLARCTHADKTELVIGLDYPPEERYVEGWKKVSEYVYTIQGFKKITILTTDKNVGASFNHRRCRDYAFEHYNTYIATEDDNEFSPCFLDYINKALTIYWEDERITAICGYNFPIDMGDYDKNIYCHHQFAAWGFGRWKHKFQLVPANFGIEVLHSWKKSIKLLKTEPQMLFMLMNMVAKQQRWGDALTVSYNIVNDCFSIFPTVTMCRNWGHDGSGLHCGGDTDNVIMTYRNQIIATSATFDLDDIVIEDYHSKSLKRYFCLNWKVGIRACWNYFKFIIRK